VHRNAALGCILRGVPGEGLKVDMNFGSPPLGECFKAERRSGGRRSGKGIPGQLTAQQPRESRFQLFFGKKLLGRSRLPRRVVVDLAIEQKLRSVDEYLGGRLAGVNGNELDARALLISEFNVHGIEGMPAGPWAVNGTMVTRPIIAVARPKMDAAQARPIILPEICAGNPALKPKLNPGGSHEDSSPSESPEFRYRACRVLYRPEAEHTVYRLASATAFPVSCAAI